MFLKRAKNLIWIVILIGCVTAGIDYYRITKGDAPIFCIRNYNANTHIETSRGLFYKVDRNVKWNNKEKYNLSKKIEYHILGFIIPISLNRPKQESDFVLYVEEDSECLENPLLYLELEDYNIYLDCIHTIKWKDKEEKETKELKDIIGKDNEKLTDFINKLSFLGLDEDNQTEIYHNLDDTFINKPIYLYKCHTNENKDIYITTKTKKQDDYCTVKNDNKSKEQE